ncbi:MAG: hypothetical protein AB8I08_13750 [Sandaracinaceae bacterium]
MSTAEERLSRHHDGELSKKERKSIAKALDKHDDLRAKLEGLSHLSMLISASHEHVAAEVDSDALFDAITARLATDEVDTDPMFPEGAAREADLEEAAPAVSQQRPALRVVKGGKKATPKPPARVRNKELDRRTAAMMLFGGLAAAAAVVLAVMGSPPGTPHATTIDQGAIAQAPPPGSEIEEVDFGANTGAIFSVEGQEGEQYAVIWISDEKVADEEVEEHL